MDYYLTKPFHVEEIHDVLRQIVCGVEGNTTFVSRGGVTPKEGSLGPVSLKQVKLHLAGVYRLSAEKVDALLRSCTITISDHLDDVRNAIDENNFTELSAAAHSLKGVLLNLGLNGHAAELAAIEQSAKDKDQAKDYKEAVVFLNDALGPLISEINQLCSDSVN